MPIILLWNETVETSLPQFRRWLDVFAWSNFLLEKWLERRLYEAEQLSHLTASFPVFRFYNEVVTARVGRFQFGSLLTAPVEGVGDHVERALEQWNVPRRVSIALRENQLLPEFFRVLEEITGGILASIQRFRTPTAELFDPTRRDISDIPGIAVMAYRALATSQAQIVRAAKIVSEAIFPPAAVSTTEPTTTEEATEVGETASSIPLEFRLDNLNRYIVGGLLLILGLARLLEPIGSDLLVHLRFVVLDFFQRIETRAYKFRQGVLQIFTDDLAEYAIQGLELIYTVEEIAVNYMRFYGKVGIAYVEGISKGVRKFTDQLEEFWDGLERVIRIVVGFGNAIIQINIGPIIHHALSAVEEALETIDTYLYMGVPCPWRYDAPREFPVTVEELVMNRGAGVVANDQLNQAVDLLRQAWYGSIYSGIADDIVEWITSGVNVPRIIVALRRLTETLSLPREIRISRTTLMLDPSGIPNFTEEIVRPLRQGIEGAVNHALTGVVEGIRGVITTLGTTLGNVAAAFDSAAVHASQMGSRQLLDRLVSDTDALMQSLFGEGGMESSESSLAPLAGIYAQWLIQAGFDAIGSVVAGFIGMMLNEWVEHLAEGSETPVEITENSPRHLIKRARLGRVHTPEIRILVNGWAPGRELAVEVADQFQMAVQGAFATGQARLESLQEAELGLSTT